MNNSEKYIKFFFQFKSLNLANRSLRYKSFVIALSLIIPISGFAQLADPFGKIITHEIKLNKQKDGTYLGAMEWTTGGADSMQRYDIKGLQEQQVIIDNQQNTINGLSTDNSSLKNTIDDLISRVEKLEINNQ
ncbi:hypothetical protein [Winogradskyella sp. R77965]|uniref:hypothetical protein n=1 Tax=Winogradskyella sp. R77965 TaxID=3093872 RepID=UPI0037DDE2AE